MSDAEKYESLTPREMRLMTLLLQGLAPDDLEGALGVSASALVSDAASIRHKLESPENASLNEKIKVQLGPKDEPAPAATSHEERRVRLLLRLTLEDALDVADDAELRANMLEATVDRMGSTDASNAHLEVQDLRHVGEVLRKTIEQLLTEIRARSSE